MIKVSICCITYNHAAFIRQCLDGLLMQQCNFEYEILIHDDASTDGTAEIIKEYVLNYPDIIKPILQEENRYSKGERGMNNRYNFPRAKGEYIAMCEGDDYWIDPLKLQTQVDILDNNSTINLVVGKVVVKKEWDSDYTGRLREFVNLRKRQIYEQRDYILYKFSQTATFVFRKSSYKNNFIERVGYSGDFEIVLNVTSEGSIYYVDKDFAVYNVHKASVSNQTHIQTKYRAMRDFWNQVNERTGGKFSRSIKMNIFMSKISTLYNVSLFYRLGYYAFKCFYNSRIWFLMRLRDVV